MNFERKNILAALNTETATDQPLNFSDVSGIGTVSLEDYRDYLKLLESQLFKGPQKQQEIAFVSLEDAPSILLALDMIKRGRLFSEDFHSGAANSLIWNLQSQAIKRSSENIRRKVRIRGAVNWGATTIGFILGVAGSTGGVIFLNDEIKAPNNPHASGPFAGMILPPILAGTAAATFLSAFAGRVSGDALFSSQKPIAAQREAKEQLVSTFSEFPASGFQAGSSAPQSVVDHIDRILKLETDSEPTSTRQHIIIKDSSTLVDIFYRRFAPYGTSQLQLIYRGSAKE